MAFHVRGFGWVYEVSDLWRDMTRVVDPEPFPRYVDPEQERARVAERMRQRELERNPPPRPWPAPEVPMRVVEGGSAPNVVRAALVWMGAAGWRSIVTYARGTSIGRGGKPGAVVGSWAIRSARGASRAVAIWEERAGKLTSKGVLRFGDRSAAWVGATEFKREVTG